LTKKTEGRKSRDTVPLSREFKKVLGLILISWNSFPRNSVSGISDAAQIVNKNMTVIRFVLAYVVE
jgi:hypothetical protein